MPYTPEQRRAIAARMSQDGKSRDEISAFFRKHGHGKRHGKSRRHAMYERFQARHG